MASYKKYAEDLIGNWETGQYEPQRNVTQNIYQTNIDKLANDFSALKDKLARNFNNAQMEYANTLNNVQNSSFNRLRNADIDLANRGLSTSGVGSLVNQADIQQKGADVDKALSGLLEANRAGVENLSQGVNAFGQGQTKLASNLAGDLGKITSQEAANAQQYANLIAGIGESKASRARVGGGRGSSKEETEQDELKRRLLIGDTLASTQLTDEEKKKYLFEYLDVPNEVAEAAVNGYNNNKKYNEQLATVNNWAEKLKNNSKSSTVGGQLARSALGLMGAIPYGQARAQRHLTTEQEKLNNMNYTDIYNLLYGDR